MNALIFAAGTFFNPPEPDVGHYPFWLTIAIWAAAIVGCWAFVGAVYALGRAMMAVAG